MRTKYSKNEPKCEKKILYIVTFKVFNVFHYFYPNCYSGVLTIKTTGLAVS